MERRYQARLDELLGDAEVSPSLLRGLLPRVEAKEAEVEETAMLFRSTRTRMCRLP